MMSFRPLNLSDLPEMKRLIADAWYGKAFALMSEEKADLAFRGYIGHYLCSCTYAEVCEIDGEFAGFLIGRADIEPLLFPDQKEVSIDNIPWIMRGSLKKISRANNNMLSECSGCGFDSELKFYITDSKFRGKGVGSALMGNFMKYLKEKCCRKMFLFTDDYCSVDYYLKRGFVEDASTKLFMGLKSHKFMVLSIEIQ